MAARAPRSRDAPPWATSATRRPARCVPVDRHPEDRTRRGTQSAWPDRIGATARQRNGRVEGVGRPDQRPDVPRIGDAPERKSYVPLAGGQVVPPEDRDDPRRVAERGHLAQELRQNVLTGDQQLDRLDAGGGCSLDQVLARRRTALSPRDVSSQREASGRAGASRSDATRSGGVEPGSASSAALARSATAANACGSRPRCPRATCGRARSRPS